MHRILEADRRAFLWINTELDVGGLEYFLILIRKAEFWIPLYVFIAAFLLINYRLKGLLALLVLLVVLVLCDQTSSHLFKPFFERIRPCNDSALSDLIMLRVRCGSGFSFTSSHATNHFGLAVSLSILLDVQRKWIGYLLLFWAAAISFSQVYVGVHYPGDVLFGALLGIIIAIVISTYANKYLRIQEG